MRHQLCAGVLLLACPWVIAAEVRTVGPGGSHATIQEAIDEAVVIGGDQEVRIATGTWAEHLELQLDPGGGSLHLSGGWTADFSARSNDPALTVVDGSSSGPGLDASILGGSVTVEGLTFTRCTLGIDVWLAGEGSLRVLNTRSVGNRNEGD